MAFVVGVGDYAAAPPLATDLQGPRPDAVRVRDLLVKDFDFPESNVCLLLDDQATMKRLRSAWKAHFRRIAKGDTVVVYFAGHGSRSSVDGAPTLVLHDSRVGETPDLQVAEFDAMVQSVYARAPDVSVWIDASHDGGPHDRAPWSRLDARWLPPFDTPAWEEPVDAMPEAVMLHGARTGMPALEQDGRGVFTTALLHALRNRPGATWHQITHDVSRWVAAQHSWQQPEPTGALDRPAFRGATSASSPWSVTMVRGAQVRLAGPPMLGWSPGALVGVLADDSVVAQVRLDGMSAGTAVGTVVGGAAKRIATGADVILEVPGEDLTAITVRMAPEVRLGPQIRQALSADEVLGQTVHVVDGSADFVVKPGPMGSVDIVGADGVRRNRLPGSTPADGIGIAQTLGLYARQASLLALSGEVPDAYPADVFEVRILPADLRSPNCARTEYLPSERALPYAQIPMCNAVQLEVTLRTPPKAPLHLGVLYLAGNGSIHTWPRSGKRAVLTDVGDTYSQLLGWVTPPLHTPDRVLVFGTHEPVDWSRLEKQVISDMKTRGQYGLDFWVAAVAGAKTRSRWAQTDQPLPDWAASLVSLEIIADPARWSYQERDTTSTCAALRKVSCDTGPTRD